MKILFVVNNYYASGNGLSASARRTVKYLREAGEEVRVLSGRNHEAETPQPDYVLADFHVPVFDGLVQSNGYKFAHADIFVIKEAVQWADVVHLEEPFILQMVTARIAKFYGVPCTATYHLHPENLFCSINLGDWKFLNYNMLRAWRDFVFNYCSHIQCPTEMVRDYLEKSGTRARLHVISNGIRVLDVPVAHIPPADSNLLDILCVGRLANEKSQVTLLEAMRYSKYADRIRLTFAGNGPKEGKYKRMAQRLYDDGTLSILPDFGFYTPEELTEMARRAYLYVHCAWVEVEGLSCVEAVREGAVPVIAQGDLIGTPQFALVPESLYPERDSKALAERIDWWIEHREEHDRMSAEYAASVGRFNVEDSIAALIKMYETAIAG